MGKLLKQILDFFKDIFTSKPEPGNAKKKDDQDNADTEKPKEEKSLVETFFDLLRNLLNVFFKPDAGSDNSANTANFSNKLSNTSSSISEVNNNISNKPTNTTKVEPNDALTAKERIANAKAHAKESDDVNINDPASGANKPQHNVNIDVAKKEFIERMKPSLEAIKNSNVAPTPKNNHKPSA